MTEHDAPYPRWLDLQKQSHLEFAARLDAVTNWDAQTPDDEWLVRDLVRHVIEEQQWVPHILAGRTIDDAGAQLEPLGDDLVAEWHRYSLAATSAWQGAAADAQVQLSRDTVSAAEYLREQVSDVVIHTWDLARATGGAEKLADALVEAVWSVFEPHQDTLAASGLYAPKVEIPDDAPLQSRLLAVTGRDDRR